MPSKEWKSQINNLLWHLQAPEKQEQPKPKVSESKKLLKIRAETSEIQTRYTKV